MTQPSRALVPEVHNPDLPAPAALMNALAQVLDNPVALDAIRDRYHKLKAYWDEFMVPVDAATQIGDYGVQPGTKSITLRLSGARKLKGFFAVTDRPRVIRLTEEIALRYFKYDYEVDIISRFSGETLAVGTGSANTYESKVRYRTGDRVCPECNQPAIRRSKYGLKGWWCSDRLGGCKAEWVKDDKVITDQQVGRVENPDVFDSIHNIQRIGKKRAFVDGMVQLVNACGFDVEIDPQEDGGDDDGDDSAGATTRTTGASATAAKKDAPVAETITEDEQKALLAAATTAGHKWADVVAYTRQAHAGVDLAKTRVPKAIHAALLDRVSKPEPLLAEAAK